MSKNKINIIHSTLYVILNLFQIIALGFSLMVYTSFNKNLSWYESCGTQFLAIPMISIPLLLLIGLGFKFLSKNYNISKSNIKLPLYAAALIFLPILDGSLNRVLIAIGGWICVALFIITIYFVINHFKNINNKQDTLIL